MNSRKIVAIDPGKKKCGIVVVDNELKLFEAEVIDNSKLVEKLQGYLDKYKIYNIVIGSGTYSKEIIQTIKNKYSQLLLTVIAEKNTTILARKKYFAENPPRGLLKIIPTSARIPPKPYDDYSARIIAERFFQKENEKKYN
ncbi:MAG: pre-16S rRNA-processing nuclease YqgF [Atribacterota bacterium]|nr:pre-16S rRNA-processing nuclease YqgF [Atribacterota bacterium]